MTGKSTMDTKTTEYVERQRLKEAISADCQHLLSFDVSLYEMFMVDIEEIPAADVEPVVHARWEKEVYVDPCGADWTKYRCSLCGRIEIKKEPYCNCGAKMDKEDARA